ncbi:MAG: hypothetical protein JXB62_05890 [Pirellulales bacterium]|nr:hypothetical protein [Pirellulales bacterium]
MRISLVFAFVVAVAVAGCQVPMQENLPPAQMLMHPGPGVDGPGPGVMMYQPTPPVTGRTSQVAFVGPEGMTVAWDEGMPGHFDSEPLICPGRYNFPQGAIYRLKLTNVPGRPGVELYPTLEVGPAMPRTEAFLSHNSIPVQFAEEDFDQVLSGNFVTKVIYLPDPEYQELAVAGVETLVSTRLDPGVDPIVEADRRGAILAIVRLGNKDLEIPGELIEANGVMPASYLQTEDQAMAAGPTPMGTNVGSGSTMPGHYISGLTGPQYGMPMCGTPIGLPGPPHVPLGIPAGLQKHTIRNHTKVHIPKPTRKLKIDVRQNPGFSYPKPPSHAYILEQTVPAMGWNRQPAGDKCEVITPDCTTGACESGACPY